VAVDRGSILRFAQDCSELYGASVRAFEITELTLQTYREDELPGPVLTGSGRGWNAERMHHLDLQRVAPDRWLAAVDGYRSQLGRRTLIKKVLRSRQRGRGNAASALPRRPPA